MTSKRRKKHKPEQIVAKLRDADAMLNTAKDLEVCGRPWGSASRPSFPGLPCRAGTVATGPDTALRMVSLRWTFRRPPLH
jgi:hypothetical protein